MWHVIRKCTLWQILRIQYFFCEVEFNMKRRYNGLFKQIICSKRIVIMKEYSELIRIRRRYRRQHSFMLLSNRQVFKTYLRNLGLREVRKYLYYFPLIIFSINNILDWCFCQQHSSYEDDKLEGKYVQKCHYFLVIQWMTTIFFC